MPLEPNNLLYLSLDRLESFKGAGFEYAKKVLSRAKVPIIKTHSFSPKYEDLGFFGQGSPRSLDGELAACLSKHGRVIYVLRDFKKVMPSFHLWMSGFSELAQNTELSEFMRQEVGDGQNRIQQWGSHFKNWSTDNRVEILNFSDLIESPSDVAKQLAASLGLFSDAKNRLPKKTSRLNGRFSRVFGVRPESTAILGQLSNQVGLWKDLVSPEDAKSFCALVANMDDAFEQFVQ